MEKIILTYNAYRSWVKRFLLRHNLSISKASHLEQKIWNYIKNLTYKFLLQFINGKITTQINDDIRCIIKVDQNKK